MTGFIMALYAIIAALVLFIAYLLIHIENLEKENHVLKRKERSRLR